MQYFEINGGKSLNGEITANGNKNEILPILAAALLTKEPMILTNVPGISDVDTMLSLITEIGGKFDYNKQEKRLVIDPSNINKDTLSRESCTKIRTSILFVAPMLHRCKKTILWPPGGDVIGRRRLDVHFDGLEAMGCKIVDITANQPYQFIAPENGLHGCEFFLPEASVTGSEQLITAAVLAKGTTKLINVACEPHVQNLVNMLNKMGAKIQGVGSNVLTITGVEELHGCEFEIGDDFVEVSSYLALVAMTNGSIKINGINPVFYNMIAKTFDKLGVKLEFTSNSVSVAPNQTLNVQKERSGGMLTIDDGTWPHVPSDIMSVLIVLSTQINGTVLFFEKMFESRIYFVDRLIAMGANAVICDPHRAVISGPSQLQGIELSTPDIRAGIAMVGAALCAQGKSKIFNVELIDRGYANIEENLRALGADIKRINI